MPFRAAAGSAAAERVRTSKSWSAGLIGGLVLVCAPRLRAQFSEVEPNDNKSQATLVAGIASGGTISGVSTGSSGSGLDYFRVKTSTLPRGIYRHRLIISTSGPTGHTGTIRGLSQNFGNIIAGTDVIVQTSTASTTPPRFNQWYGFGRQEEIYYRVVGTSSTTEPYTCTLETTGIMPFLLGDFSPGTITISTLEQGHMTDTDLWVYDADLDPIATYGNDDESVAGGGTGLTTQSLLTRTYAQGIYYLALTNFNFANHLASPPDDDFRNGNVLDFPDAAANSSTAADVDISFAITDAAGTHTFPASKTGPYDTAWFKFTVGLPPPDYLATCLTADPDQNSVDVSLPAGLLGPGCEAFDGRVFFAGGALDPANLGNTDQVIQRATDPVVPDDPPGTLGMTTLEAVALDLVSVEPITVMCAAQPHHWDVTIALSSVPVPLGTLVATKTHSNGGTFDAILPVHPLLTFRRAGVACTCGDIDPDGGPVGLNDYAAFAACFGQMGPGGGCDTQNFGCSDLNGDGRIDLADFGAIQTLFGSSSADVPPLCSGGGIPAFVVLDTGQNAPPILLSASGVPFVHAVSPALNVLVDPDAQFVPGINQSDPDDLNSQTVQVFTQMSPEFRHTVCLPTP
jgi:hypothetical protein